jgi:hypothetical protein
MADSPSHPDDERRPAPGMPRWVKVLGIVALVLVLLTIVLILVGGGSHGPGRHVGGDASPAGVAEDRSPSGRDVGGHTPPEGGHR